LSQAGKWRQECENIGRGLASCGAALDEQDAGLKQLTSELQRSVREKQAVLDSGRNARRGLSDRPPHCCSGLNGNGYNPRTWAPALIAHPRDHMTWSGNAINLAIAAAAWVVADWLARKRYSIILLGPASGVNKRRRARP
jgi:hypothetical protein